MAESKKKRLIKVLLLYTSVAGPGLVAALAGNGASGITTYSVVGSEFGLSMAWLLLISAISLTIFQEMSARMGAVTGKGLASLIREKFGIKPTFFAMLTLLAANVAITVAEFAGIAASLEIIGVSRYLTMPFIAALIWLYVTKGSFEKVEKAFLVICLVQLSYVVSGIIVRPDWAQVGVSLIKPEIELTASFMFAAIAIVGTTIAPWMQFFTQSNVVDKGIDMKNYYLEKADVIMGSAISNIIALFIMICTAFTLYPKGQTIHTAKEAAAALEPFAGTHAVWLFALGLFGASMLSASVVPLSTSYAVSEAFGWESGIGRRFSEAPLFFGLYTFFIVSGVVVVLIPGISLVGVMLLAQVLNGILLPIILIYMLRIANDRSIMGDHVNGRLINVIASVIAVGIIGLSLILLFQGIFSL
ncbi:MAG: divalent metal cation transporter [Actinobacteria bacterium]|nr:divalent metal cation transporter [Actinomycetota bacterium]